MPISSQRRGEKKSNPIKTLVNIATIISTTITCFRLYLMDILAFNSTMIIILATVIFVALGNNAAKIILACAALIFATNAMAAAAEPENCPPIGDTPAAPSAQHERGIVPKGCVLRPPPPPIEARQGAPATGPTNPPEPQDHVTPKCGDEAGTLSGRPCKTTKSMVGPSVKF